MQAAVIMILGAIIWSLYPIAIVLAEDHIGPAMMVLVINISCGVAAMLFSFLKVRNRSQSWNNMKSVTKTLEIEHWMYLMLLGIVTTLANYCMIYAMEVGSKTGAAIIIETWPIIAALIAPLLISKVWKRVSTVDIVAGMVALCGVALIMIQDFSFISFDESEDPFFDLNIVIGSFAALIGSLTLAASIVLGSEVSNRLSKFILKEKKHSLGSTFVGESVRRLVAMPTSILLLWAYPEDIYFDAAGIWLSIAIGVVIFCLGNVAITLSLLRASSSSINILYYISPVLAVIWLYAAGYGEITYSIIVGGMLVILANILAIQMNNKYKVESMLHEKGNG